MSAVLCCTAPCYAVLRPSVTAICTSRPFVAMYFAAFWLLVVAWQWIANKRHLADTQRELRGAASDLYSSRKRELALEAQLAALNARIAEQQAGKVSQDTRSIQDESSCMILPYP